MNNSKQTVLSIVGIAILVIAVVGVSFAFFTYSRNGETNNLITTGQIIFDSNVDTLNATELTNKFPQTLTDGKTNQAYQFTVEGTVPTTANNIYYNVTAVKGATPDGKNQYKAFRPTEVSIYVTTSGAPAQTCGVGGNESCGDTSTVISDFATGHALSAAVETAQGEQIAYGMISNTGKAQEHNYTLRMWINDSVTISDTDTHATYRAKAYSTTQGSEWQEGLPRNAEQTDNTTDHTTYDNRYVFSDMWYSLKVNVEARDTTSYAPTVTP